MKTFSLFMLLFVTISVLFSLILKDWSSQEIVLQSTLLAYIMQQYFESEVKKK